MFKLVLLPLLFASSLALGLTTMDQKTMEATAKSVSETFEGQPGFLELTYKSLSLYMISDVAHDRMRIITPIAPYQDIPDAIKDQLLESNYHLALDARYAMSDGVLYAAYIHPLSSLTQAQIISAMHQVYSLSVNFGSTYSSDTLSFGQTSH